MVNSELDSIPFEPPPAPRMTAVPDTARTEQPPMGGIGQIYVTVANFPEGKTRAFCSLNYGGVVLKGIRLMDGGSDGLYIMPPAEKVGDKWQSHFYFYDKVLRQRMQEAIVAEYRKAARV